MSAESQVPQTEQKKALVMMENFKTGCDLLANECGFTRFEFNPEEQAIYDRIKQLIEDFWYA